MKGKFVVYQYVFSLLIVTYKRFSEAVFIPEGESAFFPGLKYTLISLIFGWWGIPWGLIYTIEAIFVNLGGGKVIMESN